MKTVFLFLIACAFISVNEVTAQETKTHYFYGSVNYLFSKYPEPLASRTSIALHIPESTHVPLHFDALGYYRAYRKLTLVGGVFQVDIDHYSAYGEKLQIEYYQPSVSVFHYLDGQIGSGLFMRGDIGPALLRLSSGDRGTEKTNFGWGYLLGAGASMTVGSRVILASVNYAHKIFSGDSYDFFSMGLGIMLKKNQ